MRNLITKSAWVAVIGGTLLLAGCASVDDVKRAQATADQALEAAHGAQAAADHAQQTADQARSDVNALSGRVTTIEQEMDAYKARHRGQRG
jgi:outer membrane murein-binding lipoprotein Lpp